MKDLAIQAYIEELQKCISEHKEISALKDNLIIALEKQIHAQELIIFELKKKLNLKF